MEHESRQPPTCLQLCLGSLAAVAVCGHRLDVHVVQRAAVQRGEGAVRLGRATRHGVVVGAELGVEAVPAQALVPAQQSDAGAARVGGLHVGGSAGSCGGGETRRTRTLGAGKRTF